MAAATAETAAVTPAENEALATEAPYMPLTYERRVRGDLERTLPKPCKQLSFWTYPARQHSSVPFNFKKFFGYRTACCS